MLKPFLPFSLLALASLGFISGRADAAPLVSGTSRASMGISLSVSTSAYEITPMIGTLIDPPGPVVAAVTVGTHPLPPQGFNASVALRNHSSQDIPISLRVLGVPGYRFGFKVYNSTGTLVWDSSSGILSPALELLTSLKAGQSWRQTAFVPIFVNGSALPAGTYTLVISLLGSPQFSTTTSFVVHNVIAIN